MVTDKSRSQHIIASGALHTCGAIGGFADQAQHRAALEVVGPVFLPGHPAVLQRAVQLLRRGRARDEGSGVGTCA